MLSLRSPVFDEGGLIPARYGWEDENISPPLLWSGVPHRAAELVLVCEDLDSPGGRFVHWLLADVHPSATGIAEGVGTPAGAVAGRNGFHENGWGGPAPPPGDGPHRYLFRLFASSTELGLLTGFTKADLQATLDDRVLASGDLVGIQER